MSNLISINILIVDRNFRLKIDPANESFIRKIASDINLKVVEYKQLYAGKDMQDYLSMVILWFLSEQSNIKNNESIDIAALTESLNSIEKLL